MGDDGLSCMGRKAKSSDEVELEPRKWPLAEKVGVTGDARSDEDELVV
jgi:hypothetical protein